MSESSTKRVKLQSAPLFDVMHVTKSKIYEFLSDKCMKQLLIVNREMYDINTRCKYKLKKTFQVNENNLLVSLPYLLSTGTHISPFYINKINLILQTMQSLQLFLNLCRHHHLHSLTIDVPPSLLQATWTRFLEYLAIQSKHLVFFKLKTNMINHGRLNQMFDLVAHTNLTIENQTTLPSENICYLSMHTSFDSLDLKNCKITDDDALTILQNARQIRILWLDHNNLTDKVLEYVIESKNQLRAFSICHNHLSDDAISLFCLQLSTRKLLKEFYFGGNKVGDKTLAALCTDNVQYLNTIHIQISTYSSNTTQLLSQLLMHNKKITWMVLDLSLHQLSPDILLRAMLQNHTILYLMINNNIISLISQKLFNVTEQEKIFCSQAALILERNQIEFRNYKKI